MLYMMFYAYCTNLNNAFLRRPDRASRAISTIIMPALLPKTFPFLMIGWQVA